MRDARAHFGDLVDRARTVAPVVVTRHGRPVATMVDFEQWQHLVALAEDALDAEAYDQAITEPGEAWTLEDVKADLGL